MLNFLFGSICALFGMMTIAAMVHLRYAHRLPAITPRETAPEEPTRRCSVILPARNEEKRVEKTIAHLLNQTGVVVEIIVVDDRSSDGTAAILARLSGDEPRLRVIRIDALPDGWLGKCHACHVGANNASGEWILFTDADCWLKPDVITRALRVAENSKADHITLTPGFALESRAIRAWYLLFLTSFLSWIAGVNRDRPKAHLGLGAFNLVRASAYRACGGYAALRMSVVDDIKLGLLLSHAGKRTRAFLGADDVECHWGTTLREMIHVMEKNYFAVLDYKLWLAALGAFFAIVVLCILLLGLLTGTTAGFAAALSPFSLVVPAAILAQRVGWPWHFALGVPLMIPVFWLSLLNSVFVTLRQGGVRWRDTFYPLAQLRAGAVR
jgi:glycosyltransferase involved in cell wall biosynthesis